MLVDLLLAFVLIICDKLFNFLDFFVVFHIYTLHLELLQPLSSVEMGQRVPSARSAGCRLPMVITWTYHMRVLDHLQWVHRLLQHATSKCGHLPPFGKLPTCLGTNSILLCPPSPLGGLVHTTLDFPQTNPANPVNALNHLPNCFPGPGNPLFNPESGPTLPASPDSAEDGESRDSHPLPTKAPSSGISLYFLGSLVPSS